VADGKSLLRWTGLRFVISRSNLLTIVFGAVVVFSLPEALLTGAPDCAAARDHAISMGLWFVLSVATLLLSTGVYGLFAPSQFKAYASVSEYVLSTEDELPEDDKRANWDAADKSERSISKWLVSVALTVSALLFAVFLYFALSFLQASRTCSDPTPSRPEVRLDIHL
jgi:Ca2+/H+ antiporter